MSAAGSVFEHVAAAATAGGIYGAFVAWKPALPWRKEVRERRAGAKWRRKVFSFGGRGKNKHRDTGR